MPKSRPPKICMNCQKPIDLEKLYYTLTVLGTKFEFCRQCGPKENDLIRKTLNSFLFDVSDAPHTLTTSNA